MPRLALGYHASFAADLPSIRSAGLGGHIGSQRSRRPGWVFVFDQKLAAYDFAARYLLEEVLSYHDDRTESRYASIKDLAPVILTLDLAGLALVADTYRKPPLPGSFKFKAPLPADRIKAVDLLTEADLRAHLARHHRQVRVDPEGYVLPYLCIGKGLLLPRDSVIKPQRLTVKSLATK